MTKIDLNGKDLESDKNFKTALDELHETGDEYILRVRDPEKPKVKRKYHKHKYG